MTPPGGLAGRIPYLLVAVARRLPAGVLRRCRRVLLLSASVLQSEDMVPTGELTLDNFATLLSDRLYVDAILRSFGDRHRGRARWWSLLAYPLAYFLVRTRQPLEERADRAVAGAAAGQRDRAHLWLVGAAQPRRRDQHAAATARA